MGHCFECQSLLSGFRCRSCSRLFCRNCMKAELDQPKFCKFCFHAISNPAEVSNFSSPRSSRSTEDEDGDGSGHNFFSPRSELSQVVDSVSISTGLDLLSFKSVNSSPLDSPSRGGVIVGEQLENSHDLGYDSLSLYRNHENPKAQKPLDFENNRLIWDPPPPEDEYDDSDTGFFLYDDEDDEEVGDSRNVFSSASFSSPSLSIREKASDVLKEQQNSAVRAHFRVLVWQLLKAEGIHIGNEGGKGWLDVVSSLAWQAANFVKPDTRKGSSMDPGDYVKVKCILSGSPSDSTLVKGVVCTKNVRHKRMVSQHKNPRLLLLGGALEYQRVTNKLASINTVLEEEIDHLKAFISKIDAHRPNVLLVEKSVSLHAQEHLLTKEISLVLNVKKTLLERIARCTGAQIAPSIDIVASARLGHCEMFRVEKFIEQCSYGSHLNKKSMKTLMFFEGCPRRLGCTVLLRGMNPEELKKIKHAVQYATFAAYHLSREKSFLADEGATFPKVPLNFQKAVPSTISDTDSKISQTSNSTLPYSNLSSCSSDAINPIFSNNTQILGDHSTGCEDLGEPLISPSDVRVPEGVIENTLEETNKLELHKEHNEANELSREATDVENEATDYFSSTDSQSILVSLSTTCVLKGTVCEPSQLVRIKFYGSFDKPLGRYLRDDLFDQTSRCRSCKEPAEAHMRCYTHHHGSLTISVRRHPSMKLPGERDGRIWMWHRCLKCEHNDGVPPATRRVVMSHAAWGLSFGKFLELSFSNHATANRVASCGHSLQKDCIHFYGSGNMIAFFRYSPFDILSVRLPTLVLNFACLSLQEWVKGEATAFACNIELLHTEVNDVLQRFEQRIATSECEPVKTSIHKYITDLRDLLRKEINDYDVLLQPSSDNSLSFQETVDILELNHLSKRLLVDCHTWDRRLGLLDTFLKSRSSTSKLHPLATEVAIHNDGECRKYHEDNHSFPNPRKETDLNVLECNSNNLVEMDWSIESVEGYVAPASLNLISNQYYETQAPSETFAESSSLERLPSAGSVLSDKIDYLWSGNPEADSVGSIGLMDNPLYRKVISPLRVNSFDSALRIQGGSHKVSYPASLHLNSVKSFDASGFSNMQISQRSPRSKRLDFLLTPHTPAFLSSTSHMVSKGARLLLPPIGHDNIVIAVYDNEPTSIISYAINSQGHSGFINTNHQLSEVGIGRPSISHFQSDEEPHFRISFDDESSIPEDKVKFSVTCYFARQFAALRKKCCPNDADFLRSMSRCRIWKSQGGKSNVKFYKSLDDRLIIKQVTKTELDSFEVFASEYFKYMMDSIDTGSPTCLAKVLGIYQVNIRHLHGGRQVMDVLVMENLFFGRTLSKVYDLKGSLRARYNHDTSGKDNVLLDLNLLESLGRKPIYLGSKAKRSLERAVWNDTSFLASVDVMDYSLLVGVDDDRKELIIGIIDFIRQYTWDKHLESWVKATGILGGSKNESPTVVSPLQYKKRFRKAMSKYFLTVPDQRSSSP